MLSTQIAEHLDSGGADRDAGDPLPPGAAEGVGDDDADPRAGQFAQPRADSLGRGIGVEKALTNNLAYDLVGAPRTSLGTAFATDEALGALGMQEMAELEIALLAKTELGCGLFRPQAQAISFEEHGEFDRAFVLGGNGQHACGADEGMAIQIEMKHGDPPERSVRDKWMADNGRGCKV